MPSRKFIIPAVFFVFVLQGLAVTQAQKPAHSLLGTGRGVDHVGIAVRDLGKTINDYEQVLGFKYFKAPPFTDGTVRSFIFFENNSYLELFSVANVTDETKYFAAFAEKHEGAIYLGLATSSASDAADYLMAHPNTALRIHSVWFAVRNLDASLRNLHDAGFEPGENRKAKFLGAKGREVKAGDGCMLLLRSVDQKGVLNTFLSDHDDGDIIGVSIEVSDLNKARSWVEGHSGHKLEPYKGFYGQSMMIPPDLAHGVWMELFQR
jgi:catechol 2,3-dioxygenase-like lactoylglutathione lyase family enzyme